MDSINVSVAMKGFYQCECGNKWILTMECERGNKWILSMECECGNNGFYQWNMSVAKAGTV